MTRQWTASVLQLCFHGQQEDHQETMDNYTSNKYVDNGNSYLNVKYIALVMLTLLCMSTKHFIIIFLTVRPPPNKEVV